MRPTFVVVLLNVCLATPAASQPTTTLAPGTRVRVTTRDSTLVEQDGFEVHSRDGVGTLVALKGDSLILASGTARTTWHMPSVTRLEVYRGRESAWPVGALVGAAVAGVGSLILLSTSRSSSEYEVPEIFVVLVGAAGGALLGAGIGAPIRRDHLD